MKIFVGWDSREDIAYQVCRESILALQPNAEIIPLKQKELRKGGHYWRDVDTLASTEFTFTRFLIPHLCNYKGWALFIDCDFVALDDVKNLFDQVDDRYAVMCAQHDYTPRPGVKMDGQTQTVYPRKNWSSMMLINCGHPSNKKLTKDLVNNSSVTGKYLHRLSWLNDSEIGSISHEWNWLVGVYKEPEDGSPKFIHYTEGGPWFKQYQDCEYNYEWYKVQTQYLQNKLESAQQSLEHEKNKIVDVDNLSLTDQKKR